MTTEQRPPALPVTNSLAITAPPRRAHPLRRLVADPVSATSIGFLLLMVLACIAAPLLTPFDPMTSSLVDTLAPMSSTHPLGGDGVGRDVLARLLYGGRLTLVGASIAVGVALIVGVPLGLLAGYYRGLLDGVAGWIASLVMAVPAIIIMLVVMAAVSRSIFVAMAILGVILAPGVYRLVRSCVLGVREELYVDAARVAGLTDSRIMRRHILPVVIGPVLVQSVGTFGVAVGIQAGIAFLGIGDPSEPSWGSMLNDAFPNVYVAPMLLLWPGLAIGLTVASLTLIGNTLRDSLISVPGQHRRRHRGATVERALSTPQQQASRLTADSVDHLLAVEELEVSYALAGSVKQVVHDVSLYVDHGEVLGLVGESGSGKSQTAFALLGLLPPNAEVASRRMLFDGIDLARASSSARNTLRGRRIAYIPQEPMSNLDPSFTIGSQLMEPLRQHLGLPRPAAKKRVLDLLERVGIRLPERVFNSYPHQVSGGMAQRVLIAGAVSCEPDLLIADEPTTALDVTVQAEILDLIRSLQSERRMGVILVTHDFGVVADICDRVSVMRSGRIIESAPTRQLFAAPQDDYTKMLLASTLENAPTRRELAAAENEETTA